MAAGPVAPHHIAFIPTGEIGNVQARIALVQQKQLEAAAAEEELRAHIRRVTGVDLERENWELDPAHWALYQRADAEGTAVNPMDVIQ